MITFLGTSRQTRKLIFGIQPYFNPTRRNYGRQPHLFQMEDDLNVFQMEDNLMFFQMEDDLDNYVNERRPKTDK